MKLCLFLRALAISLLCSLRVVSSNQVSRLENSFRQFIAKPVDRFSEQVRGSLIGDEEVTEKSNGFLQLSDSVSGKKLHFGNIWNLSKLKITIQAKDGPVLVKDIEALNTGNVFHPDVSIMELEGDSFIPIELDYTNQVTFSTSLFQHSKEIRCSITFFKSESQTLITGTVLTEAGVYNLEGEQFDEHLGKVSIFLKSLKVFSDHERSLLLNPELSTWTDCFPGQNESFYFLDIGAVADLSFFNEVGSVEAAIATIKSYISNTNIVYSSQLSVFLRVKQLIIVTDTSKVTDSEFSFFKQTGSTCTTNIEALLNNFRSWVQRVPSQGSASTEPLQQGIWELFTACYKTDLIGSAFSSPDSGNTRGTLCMNSEGLNSGVNSLSDRGFVNFAHEIGHNFGASHSFENGVGSTGGIMDYGNGEFNGNVQFRPERRPEICEGLTRAATLSICKPFFTPFNSVCAVQPTCDDGICENGVCVKFFYNFTVNGIELNSAVASTSLATPFVVGTSITTGYKVLDVSGDNPFACEPDLSVAPSSTKKFLLLQDDLTLKNCSYLLRAQNIKNSGFQGALMYFSDSPNLIVMNLSDVELLEGSLVVSNFDFRYISGSDGKALEQLESLNLPIFSGWVQGAQAETFNQLSNVNVPRVLNKEKLILGVGGAVVGIFVISGVAFVLFFENSTTPSVVQIRTRVHSHMPSVPNIPISPVIKTISRISVLSFPEHDSIEFAAIDLKKEVEVEQGDASDDHLSPITPTSSKNSALHI